MLAQFGFRTTHRHTEQASGGINLLILVAKPSQCLGPARKGGVRGRKPSRSDIVDEHANPKSRSSGGHRAGPAACRYFGSPGIRPDTVSLVRKSRRAQAVTYDCHASAGGARRSVHRAGGPWAGPRSRLQKPAGVLPGRGDHKAGHRFRDQHRSLAAGLRLEWQAPIGRQRGVGRHHQLSGAFRRGRRRLRRRRDRHRTQREHRQLRDWASREGGRLRLSLGARDDGRGQSHHHRVLW